MHSDLEACLPVELRGRGAIIAPITAGLSGAGVYRVELAGLAYVLKVAPAHEARDGWTQKAGIARAAGEAGVSPRVVHVDEARRAMLTERVVDRSFAARMTTPLTRAAAIDELGRTLRRVHELPIPPGVATTDAREVLRAVWTGLQGFPLPAWVGDAVRSALDTAPPAPDRALVLSHNDVNPTNLTYDGERVLLLDWDAAGVNDPLYDLAAAAVFFRLDDASCAQLIAAHDHTPPAVALPARFRFLRRMVAALCGTLFLQVARSGGHSGASVGETLELAPTLDDVHDRMRIGALSARTPDGQSQYGQALLKASQQQFR